MQAEPFTINIPEEKLLDLQERLRRINWAPDFSNEDWAYGVNGAYLRELADYWLHEYDWPAHQSKMNLLANFRVEIEGIPIHFVHERGKGPNPMPIILSHGWPWTYWDLRHVIGPLTDPAAHGGDPLDSFDVVVPSLPGYGFSTPLTQPGINFWRTADLWNTLMQDVLGYERFAAQGGDWGALVTSQLGHKYADHLWGIHLTDAIKLDMFNHDRPWVLGDPGLVSMPPGAVRKTTLARLRNYSAHVAVQGLDPQTLSFMAHDSPIGLCAWILERRRNWGDTNGDVESRFPKDDLLTTMMLYWATESFVTSVRFYYEAAWNPWSPSHSRTPVVEAPTGITFHGADAPNAPNDEQRQYWNLHHWDRHPAGGHFAPAEEPDAIVRGIRATFRELR
ncbi:MAG: epoxide hydrolase [Dehalococcoidia bacterium]|nr:epoxide hydrolase [Dehalococcoidia bacterium]|tara:strand:+ start:43 stop:1218 length:1176 start_codon:yes stop_codon:yes gene_type:complete